MNPLKTICEEMLAELNNELLLILTMPDLVSRYGNAAKLCRQTELKLRDLIVSHTFENKQHEIWFFKEMKPQFTRLVVFYYVLHLLYLHWPPVEKAQKEHVKRVLDRIEFFFHDQRDFYAYYRSQSTQFDELYYLRCNYDPFLNFDAGDAMNDPNFCTNYDHILGRLLGYQDVEKHIREHKIYENGMESTVVSKQLFDWGQNNTEWVNMLKRFCDKGLILKKNQPATVFEAHVGLAPIFGMEHVHVSSILRNIENRKGDPDKFPDYVGDL